MQGQLTLSYSLIYGASCFVGALVGVIIVNNLVRKSGATWLVVSCAAPACIPCAAWWAVRLFVVGRPFRGGLLCRACNGSTSTSLALHSLHAHSVPLPPSWQERIWSTWLRLSEQ